MSNMVKKANTFEILNHWMMALSFLTLTVSGFGFLFQLEQISSIFGSFSRMRDIHNYAGVVFSGSLFLSLINYLPESLMLSGDDFAWIFKGGGYFSKRAVVPEQDRLNAGQKIFYLFLLVAGITISATGYVIWLLPGVRKYLLLSHLLHNISFDLLLVAVIGHIYMATLANPGTLQIMITGNVPVEWARKRHAKWVKSIGQ